MGDDPNDEVWTRNKNGEWEYKYSRKEKRAAEKVLKAAVDTLGKNATEADKSFVDALNRALNLPEVSIGTLTIRQDPDKVVDDMRDVYDNIVKPVSDSKIASDWMADQYRSILFGGASKILGGLDLELASELVDVTDTGISIASSLPEYDPLDPNYMVDPGTYYVYKFYKSDEYLYSSQTEQYTILVEAGKDNAPHVFIFGYEDSYYSGGDGNGAVLSWPYYNSDTYIHEFNGNHRD